MAAGAVGAEDLTVKRIMRKRAKRERISKNVNLVHDESLSFGEHVADKLADVAGSWPFIIWFLIGIGGWIVLNSALARPIDPMPFILLNLVLSCLAGLQAPVIMMSQNRQEAKDRLRAENDYEVNLKAELEVEDLHAKLDHLREAQWQELVAMQQRQIELLESQLAMLQKLTPIAGDKNGNQTPEG